MPAGAFIEGVLQDGTHNHIAGIPDADFRRIQKSLVGTASSHALLTLHISYWQTAVKGFKGT